MAGKVNGRTWATGGAKAAARTGARDTLTLGIAAAAITLFVGTGGQALQQVIKAMQGHGLGPDNLLVSALMTRPFSGRLRM